MYFKELISSFCNFEIPYKMELSCTICHSITPSLSHLCTCSSLLLCTFCISSHLLSPGSHTLISLPTSSPISIHSLISALTYSSSKSSPLTLSQSRSKAGRLLPQSQTHLISFIRPGGNDLLTYDFHRNLLKSVNLRSVSESFSRQTSQVLPDGSIIIAGFYYDATYRYIPMTRNCTRLKPFRVNRYQVRLFLYGDYLYAFGGSAGCALNSTERMRWPTGEWEKLPDMRERRVYPAVIGIEDKIYLIGGTKNTSIEYYDIPSNCFRILSKVRVPMGACAAGVLGNSIYVICGNELVRFNREFNIKESKDKNWVGVDVISDVLRYGKRMYYFDARAGNLIMFDGRREEITYIEKKLIIYDYY